MPERTFAAFHHTELVARGTLEQVLSRAHERGPKTAKACLFFDEESGAQIDFDLRGTLAQILARLADHPALRPELPKGPGRPKLGVSCKEVCLLPAQWDWLAQQSGGPSAALRRLVMAAMKAEPSFSLPQAKKSAVDRILLAVAGNQPGYEDASRALWSGDLARFHALVATWPGSVGAWAMGRLLDDPSTLPG